MSLDSQGDTGTYGQTGQSYGDRQTSDKSPEVGDKGGGYTEKGDPGHAEYLKNRAIREHNQREAEKLKQKKEKKISFKDKIKKHRQKSGLKNMVVK